SPTATRRTAALARPANSVRFEACLCAGTESHNCHGSLQGSWRAFERREKLTRLGESPAVRLVRRSASTRRTARRCGTAVALAAARTPMKPDETCYSDMTTNPPCLTTSLPAGREESSAGARGWVLVVD